VQLPHLHVLLHPHGVCCCHSAPAAIPHHQISTATISSKVQDGAVLKAHTHPAICCGRETANAWHLLLFKHICAEALLLLLSLNWLLVLLLWPLPRQLKVRLLLLLLLLLHCCIG
jgi:hypothetical protein